MPDETFRKLMEHAILAPTAFNIQNWRFVRVRDPERRKAIRAVAWDQAQVTDAAELLVLCFDTKAWAKEPERYWRNDIISLPDDYEIAFMIAIGEGTRASWPKPGQLPLDEVLVEDRFNG